MLGFDEANTIYDSKRVLGKRFSDEKIKKDMEAWPFKVFDGNGKPVYAETRKGRREKFHPEQITAFVLMKVLEVAKMRLDKLEEITGAVITVPANFNSTQRQATKNAGRIAGLNVINVVSDTMAAAIAYGFGSPGVNKTIMVYDLGGGKFDVSVVVIKNNEYDVKAVSGDCHFGGRDFGDLLVNYVIADIKKKHQKDISNVKEAVYLLRVECETTKRFLSELSDFRIVIHQLVRRLHYQDQTNHIRETHSSFCQEVDGRRRESSLRSESD